MKRPWFEEEKKHRFLAESKFRKFLNGSFRDFYSEFDENVSANKLASEIRDYLDCSREVIPVTRGTHRYKATSLELVQRTDLEADDASDLNGAAALIVLPNFRLIGPWIDRVRSTASGFGLDWTEARPILSALLRRYAGQAGNTTPSDTEGPGAQRPKRRGRPREDERADLLGGDMGARSGMETPRFLSVDEAAELLSISKRTIYGFVQQGRIPYRNAGRRFLFLESELVEWTKPTVSQSRVELMKR